MPITKIELTELRELLGADAQLVDVMPAAEFADEHLPGAAHISVKELDARTTAGLDRRRAVVVYCNDYL